MATVRTPNYQLSEDYTYFVGAMDTRTLPQGTFVRPIELTYVPKHITEGNKIFSKDTEVYCYTRYGILAIPRKIIREAL